MVVIWLGSCSGFLVELRLFGIAVFVCWFGVFDVFVVCGSCLLAGFACYCVLNALRVLCLMWLSCLILVIVGFG